MKKLSRMFNFESIAVQYKINLFLSSLVPTFLIADHSEVPKVIIQV